MAMAEKAMAEKEWKEKVGIGTTGRIGEEPKELPKGLMIVEDRRGGWRLEPTREETRRMEKMEKERENERQKDMKSRAEAAMWAMEMAGEDWMGVDGML